MYFDSKNADLNEAFRCEQNYIERYIGVWSDKKPPHYIVGRGFYDKDDTYCVVRSIQEVKSLFYKQNLYIVYAEVMEKPYT